MTWFKVDDSFYDNPKVEQLSLAARGLWVTAGSYAARHLTDGFVPDNIINRVGRGVAAATRELLQQGLWRTVPGGIQFHDWDQFQPSRNAVTEQRRRTSERQQAWRDRKRNAVTNGSRNGVTNSAPGDGAPTRPDPTSSSSPPSRHSPGATASGGTRDRPTDPRHLAADLLGTTPDDPRLDHLPQVLKGVRTPGPWLRATHAAGDLEGLLDGAADAARDPWAHLPRLDQPNAG